MLGDWTISTRVCFYLALFLFLSFIYFAIQARSLVENIQDTLTRPSVSAGVGLIYRFDPVRVEVNFGVPLVKSKSDKTRRGFQVGIGLEFL